MALTPRDYVDAALALNCEPAAIQAVTMVESRGNGFEAHPGNLVRPIILFEGHIFYRETGGQFHHSHPTLCYPTWTRAHYSGTQAGEWLRLTEARKLDRFAADKSASWGLFQIMGFNFAACGFANVVAFVEAMGESERAQLMAFVVFCKHERIDAFIRSRDWAGFAMRYNGPGYRANRYDEKLAAAYIKAAGKG